MTAPATASPAIMDDEEMMRLFKKFHIVTAGTRALEIIGDPAYDSYSLTTAGTDKEGQRDGDGK